MKKTLYRQLIVDLYQFPHNFGKMSKPDYTGLVFNSFCGDAVKMQIKKELVGGEEKIKEIKFLGHGCAISMAAASLLTDYLKGKPLKEINKLGKEKVLELLGIEVSPVRLKCALLPLEALKKAMKK
jgi:nitrogen fixation NifU-like protein